MFRWERESDRIRLLIALAARFGCHAEFDPSDV